MNEKKEIKKKLKIIIEFFVLTKARWKKKIFFSFHVWMEPPGH